jgi:hypothetical protein
MVVIVDPSTESGASIGRPGCLDALVCVVYSGSQRLRPPGRGRQHVGVYAVK